MRNELNIFKVGYMPWCLSNWWYNIKHFFKTVKWAWQRAVRGYSDPDTWELGDHFLSTLINALSQFKDETNGYPCDMSFEEWQNILTKIILLLKQSHGDEPLEEKNELAEWYAEYLKNVDLSAEPSEESWSKRKQYYEREAELHKIKEQKRKEAFALLAEYFDHLWW